MNIQLDLQTDVPIYTQLANQIMEGIAKRELLPGEALPSVRGLASDLGINLHTVNKAYQQLKQEGFILIHRKVGVVVNPDGFPQADDRYMNKLETALRPLIAESVCRGLNESTFAEACTRVFAQLQKKGE